MADNQGTLARLGVGAASPATLFMEYLDHDIKCYDERANDQGIRGTRSRYANRNRILREWVSGPINMNPSPTELDWWLKYALGDQTGATSSLTDALTSFYMIEDKGDTVHEWTGCVVDTMTISGSQGQPISLNCQIEAQSEEKDGDSFPAITPGTQSMFIFKDLVLTLGGTAREVESFSLKLDNVLDKNRFFNSLTRAEIPTTDRIVTLGCSLPWNGDTDDLYGVAATGIEGSLVLTDGTTTYTITFGALASPKEGPGARRGGLRFPLNFQAFHDGTNKEMVVVKS